MDITGTKILSSIARCPLLRGVIVDHAPLTIMGSYAREIKAMDHEISCIDKRSIDI